MALPRPPPAVPPAEGAILLAEYEYVRGALRAWRLPSGAVVLVEDARPPVQVEREDVLSVEVESLRLDWSYVKVLRDGELLASFDVDETFDEPQPREVAEGMQSVIDVVYAALRPAS